METLWSQYQSVEVSKGVKYFARDDSPCLLIKTPILSGKLSCDLISKLVFSDCKNTRVSITAAAKVPIVLYSELAVPTGHCKNVLCF